jgi:hypothetical protein
MRKLEMSVIVSIKLNRGHLIHGKEALILPVISRSEKDMINGELQHVSTENSMGVVEWSRGVLDPISEHLINKTRCLQNGKSGSGRTFRSGLGQIYQQL